MPRIAKLSKHALVEKLATVFEDNGFAGASMAMLAQAGGLSKASLYHFFPDGKQEMATQVLGQAGAKLQALILAPLAGRGSAQRRLQESLEGTAKYYAGAVPVCLMNSLLVGGGTDVFGKQIRLAVEIWQKSLAVAYEEAGADTGEARAWAAYAVERIQGALILCRVMASRSPLEGCLSELKEDVDLLLT